MDLTTFLISIFCLADEFLQGQRLRKRGPAPTLHDSEVITMEIVGEFLGIDTDTGIYRFFRRHYGDWFPALRRVHRTTFVRQAANLWWAKQQLWGQLLQRVRHDQMVSITDSMPLPVCRFARSKRCHIMGGQIAYGHDAVAHHTFLGLRAHLRISLPGVITDFRLAPANVHELDVAQDLFVGVSGWALGDRNYWSPHLHQIGREHGLLWLTPFKSVKREKHPFPAWLSRKRYLIDTVFGQLSERFHAKRVWARDAWHLFSRWLRKVLGHTIAVFFCQQLGLPPLHFAQLITD